MRKTRNLFGAHATTRAHFIAKIICEEENQSQQCEMGNSASHYVDDAEATHDNGYVRTEGGKRVPLGRPEMIMSKRRRRNDYLIDNRPSIAENELRNAEVYVEEVLAQSDHKKRRAPNFVNWMKYIVKTGNIRAAILNSPLTVTSATVRLSTADWLFDECFAGEHADETIANT